MMMIRKCFQLTCARTLHGLRCVKGLPLLVSVFARLPIEGLFASGLLVETCDSRLSGGGILMFRTLARHALRGIHKTCKAQLFMLTTRCDITILYCTTNPAKSKGCLSKRSVGCMIHHTNLSGYFSALRSTRGPRNICKQRANSLHIYVCHVSNRAPCRH